MDLLEYQAKELFREMGIPVLPSQRLTDPRDIKGLKIPYPVVLKSQVRAGGRGRAGGVKFVENTIDAIAAARTIFHLPILGEYPQVLLAEAKYNTLNEFYLAVVLDYAQGRPILLGSSQGGMNVEAVIEHLQQVVVDDEFSPFYGRRLAMKMGLQGQLIQSVSTIIEKMYQLFVQNDLDLIEINPLGISPTGEVMALDGKVTINDDALDRHSDLVYQWGQFPIPHLSCSKLEPDGNIVIMCNGSGLTLMTTDLIYQAGGKPILSFLLDSKISLTEQIERGLEQIGHDNGIKVILINILGKAANQREEIEQAIANYLQGIGYQISQKTQEKRRGPNSRIHGANNQTATWFPQFIVRLIGDKIGPDTDTMADLPIHWLNKLDDAVTQAITLAKPT